MKTEIMTAICLILFTSIACADGPPVREDGTITAEHISIKMDDAQIREVEKTHIVRLTAKQHTQLKKYYRRMPKTFVAVTPHYNDCTCELIYLIWNKTDTIVLPLNSVEYFKGLLENKEYPYAYQDLLRNWNKQKIIIDTRGHYYYEGRKISSGGMEKVIGKIAAEKDVASRWVFISLPPYLKTEYESGVAEAIRIVKATAERNNVRAQIGG